MGFGRVKKNQFPKKKKNPIFPPIPREDAETLPVFVGPNGLPYPFFVTADGDTITSGHGMIVKGWKSIIEKWEAEHASETGEL